MAAQFRLLRPRLVARSRDRRRAPRRRHHRRQDPRGLRRHAGHHRRLPARLGRARLPGADSHRHAERVRLLRGHDGGHRGPHHPHVSHGRLRRRPCAGHHPLQRRAALPAVLDQPDQPLHGQRLRRAARHDHGLPPAALRPAGGRGLRREPGAPRHHRRRGRAARHRRGLDVRLRQPGHGADQRGHHPLLAAREQDARPARAAAGRDHRRCRQRAHQALHREVHHQPGDRLRHRSVRGLAGAGQDGRPRDLEARLLRDEALRRDQGRLRRLGRERRSLGQLFPDRAGRSCGRSSAITGGRRQR